ncbi:MAG: amidohydrolase family protein [Candidatus Latescibacteria bacterium]|jgi:L-fuconolactonase|nr:amidohydrolase family protein [Candidatus Latescibacterota bacterium]
MRIDSHQHFWKVERGDYDWMSPDFEVLYRDYLPEDLLPQIDAHQIDRTVLVQAAQTVAETEFILGLAEGNDRIAGVVGWLDMEADDFEAQLARYRANPKLVGIRPVIHDISDDSWMIRPKVLNSLKHLADQDFPFDFLTYSRHLPYVIQVLEEVPDLRAIMDHISKPEIKAGNMAPWQELMSEVASHPNVYCKISGMITEADHDSWSFIDVIPYMRHVCDSFGHERIVYGSDWPVCLLAGSYDEVIGLAEQFSANWSEEEQRKFFGDNARAFYKL